jgi:hypothetical protein
MQLGQNGQICPNLPFLFSLCEILFNKSFLLNIHVNNQFVAGYDGLFISSFKLSEIILSSDSAYIGAP